MTPTQIVLIALTILLFLFGLWPVSIITLTVFITITIIKSLESKKKNQEEIEKLKKRIEELEKDR